MPPVKPSKKKEEQLMEEVKEIRKSNKENLVCADCPNRAPAYVCTSFATFICTDCSGVHRRFGHRVKSIAMANFTEEEVEKLRHGGNEVANAHYLARYKKGTDTFVLPREGERERIEQYLTFKYVEKKWYKEKLKEKGKKGKKSENKKDGDESDSEREEGAATPVQTATKTSQRTSIATTSSKVNLQQPSEDLLSLDTSTTQTNTGSSSKGTTVVNNTSNDDDLFGNSTTGGGESNWEPWSDETTTATTTTTTSKQKDDWGDDLWDNQTTTSTTTTGSATTKRTSQNLSSLYQSTSNSSFNNQFSNQPVLTNMTPNMAMDMGMHQPIGIQTIGMNSYVNPSPVMMNMWNPTLATTTQVQTTPSVPQSNSFLGALSQLSTQQKQEEEDKKRKEQPVIKTTTTSTTIQTETKDVSDPFASLMGGLDLNLKDSSSSTSTSTTTTTSQLTKRNSTVNTFNTTNPNSNYGNIPQVFASHPYYTNPSIPMMQNPNTNTYVTSNQFGNPPMYSTVSYMQPMNVPHPNANMYASYQPNTVSNQPMPNMWNNANINTTIGSTADSDNPFR